MRSGSVVAIDLGASNGRVIVGHVDRGRLELRRRPRFPERPVRLPDGLHWDALRLFHEIVEGLRRSARRSRRTSPAWGSIRGRSTTACSTRPVPCSIGAVPLPRRPDGERRRRRPRSRSAARSCTHGRASSSCPSTRSTSSWPRSGAPCVRGGSNAAADAGPVRLLADGDRPRNGRMRRRPGCSTRARARGRRTSMGAIGIPATLFPELRTRVTSSARWPRPWHPRRACRRPWPSRWSARTTRRRPSWPCRRTGTGSRTSPAARGRSSAWS